MTPEQYREKWGLASDYPMVAPNYAAHVGIGGEYWAWSKAEGRCCGGSRQGIYSGFSAAGKQNPPTFFNVGGFFAGKEGLSVLGNFPDR